MRRMRKRYGCPVELSLDMIGGKWKAVILARVKEAPLGYGELRRLIPNLSDKVLTERLKELQEQGLIARTGSAPRRRYTLTARAEALRPALDALYRFGTMVAAEMKVSVEPPLDEAPSVMRGRGVGPRRAEADAARQRGKAAARPLARSA